MNREEIIQVFKNWDAIREGHFLLTSGRHSARYVQCALVLQDPGVAESLCRELAGRLPFSKVDVVIGPALGGVTLAYEMARHLQALALFAERDNGVMTLRRGFSIKPGRKVLVVEDVVTTGGSVREVIEVVKAKGGEIVGTACLVDRSAGKVDLGTPLYSLLEYFVESYLPEECPLCREGIPAVKPGSRKS